MKKFASVFSVVSLVSILAVPVSSFAVTSSGGAGGGGGTAVSANSDIVAQLQAQIAALLAQVQQLQAQLAAQQGQTPAVFCHNWTNNLRVGDRGNAVDALVTALIREGFIPNPSNERIYGEDFNEQVASAVVGFQEKYASEILTPNGLSHGTGYVGASTRAKLNRLYGCGQPTQPSITVLSPNGGESWTKGTAQTIKWQDSASFSCPPNAVCLRASTIYDIKLASYRQICTSNVFPITCTTYEPYIIATAVGGSSYDWKVGNTKGDAVAPDGLYTVQICQTGTNTCDSSDSYFKITSDSTSNKPPVISGGAFPTTLSVGQTGTWTIYASDPENGALSYSVDWGDVLTALSPLSSTANLNSFTQNATFTHSYSSAGTYTVNFQVKDNAGQVARTSSTVRVGNTTQSSITVLTPRDGEDWIVGFQYKIAWTDSREKGVSPRYVITLAGSNGKELIADNVYASTYCQGSTCYYGWQPSTPSANNQISIYDVANDPNGGIIGRSYFFDIRSVPTQPSITYLSPDSGPIGTPVKISGSNFTATGNQVSFSCPSSSGGATGGGEANVSSADGGVIITSVPSLPVTGPVTGGLSLTYPLKCYVGVKNTNGTSNDFAFTITAPTLTDIEILARLESVVRNNPTSSLTPVGSPSFDFDLSGDGRVNATDQITLRNLSSLSDADFQMARDKMVSAIQKRISSAVGGSLYDAYLDFDSSGVITVDDLTKARNAMNSTRPVTHTVTLNPSSDNFFQVTSGSLTLSQLTSAGFVTTLMPGTRLEEVLVFTGNPPSPLESASATYYQWNYQGGGIAFYKVGMGLTQFSNATVSPYFMIRNNTTTSHTLTLPTNVKFFGSTVQNPTTRPWDTATSTTQSASLSEMASVLNSVQAAINQLKGQLGTQ